MGKLKEIQKKQKLVETVLVPFDADGWSEVSNIYKGTKRLKER